jgi:hypothetical protein
MEGMCELNKKTKWKIPMFYRNLELVFVDATTDTELSHTLNRSYRTVLENIQLGDIDESNLLTYLNSEFTLKTDN